MRHCTDAMDIRKTLRNSKTSHQAQVGRWCSVLLVGCRSLVVCGRMLAVCGWLLFVCDWLLVGWFAYSLLGSGLALHNLVIFINI